MNANYRYAEICRVGINLEVVFQQVSIVEFFYDIFKYCCETSIIQIQQSKKNFLDLNKKKKKKNILLYKLHTVLLTSFRKSFFLGDLHRRSKIANFCHDLMQNHLLYSVTCIREPPLRQTLNSEG